MKPTPLQAWHFAVGVKYDIKLYDVNGALGTNIFSDIKQDGIVKSDYMG
ncbi:MAG: hypothetical protein KAU06_08165 [Candidatus Marinimicrobia bacterium]|nr:hypothetical protein [Candidatus Neomarinimicrobiota bacterium]